MADIEKIAVIGSGLAGLSVSNFISNSPKFKVTIIESAARIGMDVASVTVQDQNNNPIRLDAPMRGISKSYYPTLYKMYEYLKIEKYKAYNELAWSNWNGNSSIENTNSVFFMVVFDLFRLTLHGILLKKQRRLGEIKTTLGEYLKEYNYSQRFIHHFFVPFLVAIGTCTHQDMLNYPANIILHLVCSTDHIFEQVKGVFEFYLGGVQKVCSKLVEPVDDIIYNCKIIGAWKMHDNGKWIILDSNGVRREFDRIIFATQAGIARTILRAKPPIDIAKNAVFQSQSLLQALSKFTYVPVRVVIHTEESLMPKDTSTWKGLNVSTDGKETMGTIWMNYTHKLPVGTRDFFESSNLLVRPTPVIDESKIISEYIFARSPVSKESCEGINELENLQGENSLYFVGSWVWPGMPLLEGCVASACRISERFGVARPWKVDGPEAQVWEETDFAEQPLVEKFLNDTISADQIKESLLLPFYLAWIRFLLLITNIFVGMRNIISSKKGE